MVDFTQSNGELEGILAHELVHVKDVLYRLTKDQNLPLVASFLASHPGAETRLGTIEELERRYRK